MWACTLFPQSISPCGTSGHGQVQTHTTQSNRVKLPRHTTPISLVKSKQCGQQVGIWVMGAYTNNNTLYWRIDCEQIVAGPRAETSCNQLLINSATICSQSIHLYVEDRSKEPLQLLIIP